MTKESGPTIRDLYPRLSDKELIEVEETLERYLALVLRIFERTEAEAQADQLTRPPCEVK